MATVLHNFTAGSFGVIYKDPNVSQGVNKHLTGVVPWGVHRGFVLVTAGSGLSVKLTPDPVAIDHVAAFRQSTGETLTVRKLAAAPNEIPLDLTGLENKTVVICLLATYTTNATTTFQVVAYDEASGEWTTAKPTSLPVGVVVVPGAGPIAATAVTPRLRRMAFVDRPVDQDWIPVVPNGAFEHYNSVVSSTREVEKFASWGACIGTTTVYPSGWVFSPQASGTGGRCLQAAVPAGAAEDARAYVGTRGGVGDVLVRSRFPVAPGDFVHMVVDCLPSSPVNATAALLVRSYQADSSTVIASHSMALPTSGGQQRTELTVRMPALANGDAADARWITVELQFNGSGGGSGNWRVDNAQVFVQRKYYTDVMMAALDARTTQALVLSACGSDDILLAVLSSGALQIGPRFGAADALMVLGESSANKGIILDTYRQILMRKGLAKTVTPAAHEVYANTQVKASLTHVFPGTIVDAFNVDTVVLEDTNTTCKVTFKRALADNAYQVRPVFEDTVTPANVAWIGNITEKTTTYFRFKFLKGTDNTQMNMNTIAGGFNAVVHGRWVGEV